MAFNGDPQTGATLCALLLLVTGAFFALLYRKTGHIRAFDHAVSFLDHLKEVRARLLRLVLQFAYWSVLFLSVRFETTRFGGLSIPVPVPSLFDNSAARVYVWLAQHSVPGDVMLVVSRPTEGIAAQLQVGLLLAVLLTFPALIFEAWAFFAPALRAEEERVLRRALPVAGLLFGLGAAFSYFYIVPFLFQTLYGFATPLGAVPLLTAGSLVGTLVTFALVFGLAFELPLIMVLLVKLGIVRPQLYLRQWRWAVLIGFVVAAIVTDPTLVSQLIVGTLLLGLYAVGLGASYLSKPTTAAAGPRRAATRTL